jgi:hypothetical protein
MVVSNEPGDFAIRLTQNRELKKVGVYNWTLPAFETTILGKRVATCPSAGICAAVCYARNGTYGFPAVKAAHERNLRMVLEDLPRWQAAMTVEVRKPKYDRRWIRIHDSGDFFSDAYTQAWLDVALAAPRVIFYAYTKEVARFKRLAAAGRIPPNFRYLFSLGGLQDGAIDPNVDRHSEIFPSLDALLQAGYYDQEADDREAITAPTTKIGIVANNIPGFNKKLAGRTFAQAQKDAIAAKTPRQIPKRELARV